MYELVLDLFRLNQKLRSRRFSGVESSLSTPLDLALESLDFGAAAAGLDSAAAGAGVTVSEPPQPEKNSTKPDDRQKSDLKIEDFICRIIYQLIFRKLDLEIKPSKKTSQHKHQV